VENHGEHGLVWTSAGTEAKTEILKRIARNHPAFKREPERCTIDVLALPFYPEGQLARISARDIPGSTLWFTLLPQESVAMNNGVAGVHQCNSAGPLMLRDANIHDYVKFRYFFSGGGRLFESRAKRSAVGYSGKIWVFEKEGFFEIDVNITTRGLVVELEKVEMHDMPSFDPGDFDL
jgi:hypothetical protein